MKSKDKAWELWSVEGAEWIYRKPQVLRGRWRVRRRRKADGKVQMLTLLSENLTDAKSEVQELADQERRDAEAMAIEAEEVKPQDATIADAFKTWIKSLEVRPRTLEEYTIEADSYARLLGPTKLVRDVGYLDVEKLFSERWKGLSGRTKLLRRGLLIRAFAFFKDAGYTNANPVAKVKIPRAWRKAAVRAARETGQALTLPEARRLLEACREKVIINYTPEALRNGKEEKTEIKPPEYLWWFVFISLRTALRISNLLGTEHKPGLLWRHLDLEEGILSIEGSAMKGGEPLRVPLHKELLEKLKELRSSLGRIPSPEERVIPGEPLKDGSFVEPLTVTKAFHAALRRAGLEDPETGVFLGELRNTDHPRTFRVHDLRHSGLSVMGAELPEFIVALLAGHSALKSITSRYGQHIDLKTVRKRLDGLEPFTLKIRPTQRKSQGST
jgi:integrase